MIRHLRQEEIDTREWDRGISQSMNASVFGYSRALTRLFDHWEAFVKDDYEILMPFPVYKRWGIRWTSCRLPGLYLGLFSKIPLKEETVTEFLAKLEGTFRYVIYPINKYLPLPPGISHTREQKLAGLDLIKPYPDLLKSFHPDLGPIHAETIGDQQFMTIQPNDLIGLMQNPYMKKNTGKLSLPLRNIRLLLAHATRQRYGQIWGVYSKSNTLAAACLFLTGHKKTHVLFPAESEEGREESAMIRLIHRFVAENAGKNMVLEAGHDWFPTEKNPILRLGGKEFFYPVISRNRMPIVFPLMDNWIPA